MKSPGVARLLALVLSLVFPLLAAAVTPPPPAAGAKPAAPKVEPPATIEGITIPRTTAGFLGIRLVDNRFVLTFYDAKKHKIAPNVTRAALRWPVRYQPAPERTVLNPGGDAFSFTSPKIVRPPHDFRLTISLLVEGNDDAVEFYSIDFHD